MLESGMIGRPLALLLLLVGSGLAVLASLSALPGGSGVPAAGTAQVPTPSPTPGVICGYSEYNDTIATLCPGATPPAALAWLSHSQASGSKRRPL
jgi:hypothetical protein